MSRRDEQIAEIAGRTASLDPNRLALFYEQVREAYDAASVIEQVSMLNPMTDREPSDFRVLSNSELRRIEDFNSDSFFWDTYCKELGRSVALAEQDYLFEVLQQSLSESDVTHGVGFEGLFSLIEQMTNEGYEPDVVLMPISYMVGFTIHQEDRIEWGSKRQLVWNNRRLRLLHSSRGRPLNRFMVFDHRAGIWNVKLDPQTQMRLTVAIGEQITPVHGVLWLAETVAKYEVRDPGGFRSFLPDAPLDRDFDTVR